MHALMTFPCAGLEDYDCVTAFPGGEMGEAKTVAMPWLLSARFDAAFILGVFFLAVLTGAVVIHDSSLFHWVLLFDLWVLGYHHVIATYTRLCFDKASFREHRHLVVTLLPAVVVGTLLLAWSVGAWTVVTVYFYWQWWHYTRQSWGISRAYQRKDSGALYENDRLTQAIFYSVPLFGVVQRSSEGHQSFVGMPIQLLPVPAPLADALGLVAGALVVFWLYRRVQVARQGRLAQVHTLYMATHLAIFAVAYLNTRDITVGWLIINIWHNAQYILFVWMYNSRRFSSGVDPAARFLSYISQPRRLLLYLAVCIAITGVLYWGVLRTLDEWLLTGFWATVLLYQVVNFHHYIVDSLIWKVRKPQMQGVLGLPRN